MRFFQSRVRANDTHILPHDLPNPVGETRNHPQVNIVGVSMLRKVGQLGTGRLIDQPGCIGGSTVPEDERLEQRITRQAVRAMDASARDLTAGVEPVHGRPRVHIGQHAAAAIVRRWHDRYPILRYINADRQALLIDVRKPLPNLLGVEMSHIQENAFVIALFQLRIDCPGDDISRREASHLMVILHEGAPVPKPEDAAVAPHGFRDQERPRVRMVE